MTDKLFINVKNNSIGGITTAGGFATQMQKLKEMTENEEL